MHDISGAAWASVRIVAVDCGDDRPIYGGSGRPYITAVYYDRAGGLHCIGRRWRKPEAIVSLALRAGAVGTVHVSLHREGKRGLVCVDRWHCSDAAQSPEQVAAADALTETQRIERGNAVLRRLIDRELAAGRDASALQACLGRRWAIAYAER